MRTFRSRLRGAAPPPVLLLPLALCLALVACNETTRPEPVLTEVSPNRFVEGAAVELTIRGENLSPRVYADFSKESRSRVETGFSGRIGQTSLRQVRLESNGVLKATVPEGTRPGQYALTIVDPYGRESTLEAGLRVVSFEEVNELVAGYRFEPVGPQLAFTPFEVTVVAIDAQGEDVTLFNEAVPLEDGTGTVVPKVAGFFARGRWTGQVELRAPAEANVLTVRDRFGKSGSSNPFPVTTRPPVSLRFATPPRTAVADTCSAALTVQLLDDLGAPTAAAEALPLALVPHPALGFNLYADAGCTTPLGAAAIPRAATSLTFHFRSVRAGSVRLEALAQGFVGASQVQTVIAAPASTLAFVTSAQTVSAGACSGQVVLQSQDAFGNALPMVSNTAVALDAQPSTGFSLYADASCMAPLGGLTIPAGQSAATLYFRGTRAGQVTLGAQAPSLASASQVETVTPGPATSLAFLTPAQTRIIGTCSGEVQVGVRDAYGNAAPGPARDVALDVSPALGLRFYSDAGCAQEVTQATVASLESGASFFFRGQTTGTFTVAVSAAGLTGDTQLETLVPPPPDRLVFTSAAQMLSAGECSGEVTVQAQDVTQTPRAPSTAVIVDLTSMPAAGITFFADAGCTQPVSQRTMAAGTDTVRFHFRGTVAGMPLLVAYALDWQQGMQAQTVLAADPQALGFSTPPRIASAGDCSLAVHLEAQDIYGNPAQLPSSVAATLSFAPALSFQLFSDAACTTPLGGGVTLPAGNTGASLYFSGTAAAAFTVSASASGLTSASQVERVAPRPATQLVFVTPPYTVNAGACSGLLTVQAQDVYGNPSPAPATTALALSTSAQGFGFYSDGSCTVTLAQPAFAVGADTASFYVRGTVAGPAPVRADAFGADRSQTQTVLPGPTTRLEWSIPGGGLLPRAAPVDVALEAMDAYGNATPDFSGTVQLAISTGGQVRCLSGCPGAATTYPFLAGRWVGELSLGGGNGGFRLTASSGPLTGTSTPFSLASPIIASSPPLPRLDVLRAGVEVGEPVLFDAGRSVDVETAAGTLEVSWDFSGVDPTPAPWTPWSAVKTASHAYAAPGVYQPRVAVRDGDGNVVYARTTVVVEADASAICRVDTASMVDDGAAGCQGPFGADGLLSFAEAARLSGPSQVKLVSLAPGLRVVAGTLAFDGTGPLALTGGKDVVVEANLRLSGTVQVVGLTVVGNGGDGQQRILAGATVRVASSRFTYRVSFVNEGDLGMQDVRMDQCGSLCIVTGTPTALSLEHSQLSGSSATSAVVVVGCDAGDPPVSIRASRFGPLRQGISSGCRPVDIRHTTFRDGERGVVLSGGTGHVLEGSLFLRQSGEAVSCSNATFTSIREALVHGGGPAGCLSGTPGLLTQDPLFLFPVSGDDRLAPGSPAVDSATVPGFDLNGPAPADFDGAGADRGGVESR